MGSRISRIKEKGTNLSTKELADTQSQRLGKSLPDPTEPMQQASDLSAMSGRQGNVGDAPLQKKSAEDFKKIDEANRRNYVLDGGLEEAMKKGNISRAEYVQAMAHKAKAEGRELNAYENTLKTLYSDDILTPEQKKKKERREMLGNVFSNLGTLIGNIANLHNTARGGLPVSLNVAQAQQNARYQQAIDKRKALEEKNKEQLLAAQQDDIKAARERAAEERRYAHDMNKFNIQMDWEKDRFGQQMDYNKGRDAANDAYRDRQLEHQGKVLSENVRSNKANESLRWAQYNKPQDSVVSSDGYVYTINRPLSIKDKRSIIDSMARESVHRLSYVDERGIRTTFGEAYPQRLTNEQWEDVYNQAESMGLITPDILVARGLLKGRQPMKNPAQSAKANSRDSYAGGYNEPKRVDKSKDLTNIFK